MKVEKLDHLVLTVKDIEATCRFYADVLGMEIATFDHGRLSLKFGTQKINLHELNDNSIPKALNPTPGSIDLCLITKDSLAEVIEHFQANQVEIIDGPVVRTGAAGKINSIYIRDPDCNLIEISNYFKN